MSYHDALRLIDSYSHSTVIVAGRAWRPPEAHAVIIQAVSGCPAWMRAPRFLLIIIFFLDCVSLSLSCHLITLQIFIISGDLIDQLSARDDLHDPVRRCLYDLMISGAEKQHAGEFRHPVIERSDGFHIQVVRRLI